MATAVLQIVSPMNPLEDPIVGSDCCGGSEPEWWGLSSESALEISMNSRLDRISFTGCWNMASEAEYSEFEEKVKRTVYLDNLSPQITESIVNKSVSQFRIVKNVQFIPNYLEKNIPLSHKPKQADAVVSEISHKPFMVGGMPRPVRAHEAKPEMFEDRPAKPGREIQFLWVDKKDPDFEVANRLKQLAKDHALEVDVVLNQQVKVEEKLAERQQLALKVNHEKFEMINGVITDGTAKRLANRYHIRVADYW